MKNNNNLIAKRYARSLLDLAHGEKEAYSELLGDLNNTKEILNSSHELYQVLTNPVISAKNKEEIIDEVFKKDIHQNAINFLKLLVSKNRFDAIGKIIELYAEMYDEINNIAHVDVTSAIELDEGKKEQIKNKLREKFKKEIKIEYKLDDKIIAGLVYKIGDDVIDTSLAHKIEKFKKEILK